MDAGDLVLMFKACNLVFKHDVATVRFLLPYIVHNALAHGSDAARESVRAEIEAVLRSGHASREGELCVQEVFSLLDALNKAVAEARAAAAPAPSGAPHSFQWPPYCAPHTSAPARRPIPWCNWSHLFLDMDLELQSLCSLQNMKESDHFVVGVHDHLDFINRDGNFELITRALIQA